MTHPYFQNIRIILLSEVTADSVTHPWVHNNLRIFFPITGEKLTIVLLLFNAVTVPYSERVFLPLLNRGLRKLRSLMDACREGGSLGNGPALRGGCDSVRAARARIR